MPQEYNPNNIYDRNSIIERLDPSKQIPLIIEHLLGIRAVRKQSGAESSVSYIRYNKPTFTEEYIRVLEHQLSGYVNAIFTFSRFEPNEVKTRIRNIGLDINRSFAIKGNDNYISDASWSRILKIHDKKENKDSASGWIKHNINWSYDKPVTMEMLVYVKDFDETCDQDVIFSQISHQIRRMIEASYRRSLGLTDELGMMTSVLAGTTQERNVISQNQSLEQNQGLPTQQWGNG